MTDPMASPEKLARWKQNEERLESLTSLLDGRASATTLAEARFLTRHNEFGLAFDALVAAFVEDKIELSPSEVAAFHELAPDLDEEGHWGRHRPA